MENEKKPIIHIDASERRPGLPELSDGRCPKCGSETEMGFGLAGGGYGPYTFCPSCEIIVSKSEDKQ